MSAARIDYTLELLLKSVLLESPTNEDALFDSFSAQIGDGSLTGAEQQVGDMICDHPIQFFRHLPVPRTEACFDVGDGYPQLCGAKSRRQRRVGIPVRDHNLGLLGQ